uniref:Aquaporin 8ab-2 n=1 Tax=Cyprinus carpio TaxID=7962 RepID=A0A173N0L3_CYPCA|nr:aquaporin 8ab-2 [Cyprinus carpio]
MSAQAEKLELEELDKTLLKKNEPKPLGKYERIIQPYVAELENYMNATGATFSVLKSDEQLGKAVFAEMAMTCLVTMVVLLGAVNGKSKSPLV